LKDGREIGVAKRISQTLLNGFEVKVNNEVLDFYQSNKDFAEYLTAFLYGKPFWLLNDQACH
jgi:F0F1-type ATP synthase delta subunit